MSIPTNKTTDLETRQRLQQYDGILIKLLNFITIINWGARWRSCVCMRRESDSDVWQEHWRQHQATLKCFRIPCHSMHSQSLIIYLFCKWKCLIIMGLLSSSSSIRQVMWSCSAQHEGTRIHALIFMFYVLFLRGSGLLYRYNFVIYIFILYYLLVLFNTL